MLHELPKLPYEIDSLEPYISKETLEYHYGKHHKIYVDNLNNLIIWTEFENLSLEEIVKKAPAGWIFNNAAQVWNHSFYFLGLTPNAKPVSWKILKLINRDFWSFENFKEAFSKSAIWNFGSGWTWLILNSDWKLEIINTSNAWSVLTMSDKKPLLTCDVWEHAYYIDVRNARAKYLENFWSLVDWKRVESLV